MKPVVNLTNIYEELNKIKQSMITRSEMNQLVETLAILSNSDTIRQINESEKDIATGSVKEINSVSDL